MCHCLTPIKLNGIFACEVPPLDLCQKSPMRLTSLRSQRRQSITTTNRGTTWLPSRLLFEDHSIANICVLLQHKDQVLASYISDETFVWFGATVWLKAHWNLPVQPSSGGKCMIVAARKLISAKQKHVHVWFDRKPFTYFTDSIGLRSSSIPVFWIDFSLNLLVKNGASDHSLISNQSLKIRSNTVLITAIYGFESQGMHALGKRKDSTIIASSQMPKWVTHPCLILWVGGFEISVTQCMSNGNRVFTCKSEAISRKQSPYWQCGESASLI